MELRAAPGAAACVAGSCQESGLLVAVVEVVRVPDAQLAHRGPDPEASRRGQAEDRSREADDRCTSHEGKEGGEHGRGSEVWLRCERSGDRLLVFQYIVNWNSSTDFPD